VGTKTIQKALLSSNVVLSTSNSHQTFHKKGGRDSFKLLHMENVTVCKNKLSMLGEAGGVCDMSLVTISEVERLRSLQSCTA
jgi:hypothetical protein